MKGKLTRKQRIFIAEYQKDCNATQAAIRAGYSAKMAYVIGPRLVGQSRVKEAIEKANQERLKRLGVDADAVVISLARIGHYDLRKLYREDGTLKTPSEWDDDTAVAVAGVEILEEFEGRGEDRVKIGYTKKVRVQDRTPALVTLAKHLKLLGDETVKLQLEQMAYTDEEKALLKELAIARARKGLEALKDEPKMITEGKEE